MGYAFGTQRTGFGECKFSHFRKVLEQVLIDQILLKLYELTEWSWSQPPPPPISLNTIMRSINHENVNGTKSLGSRCEQLFPGRCLRVLQPRFGRHPTTTCNNNNNRKISMNIGFWNVRTLLDSDIQRDRNMQLRSNESNLVPKNRTALLTGFHYHFCSTTLYLTNVWSSQGLWQKICAI